MRILVPWRAFGDLATARRLIDEHEAILIGEVEAQRDARLADIEDAFGPVLEPLAELREEGETLDALDLTVKAVDAAITAEHPYFHPLAPFKAVMQEAEEAIAAAPRADKAPLKADLTKLKAVYTAKRKALVAALKGRGKHVGKAIKELAKLQEERDSREQDVRLTAERELTHLREAAVDLRRICADPDEARRYFTLVERAEIEENEFNLNLPRYVDTFEPEKVKPLAEAAEQLNQATEAAHIAQEALQLLLKSTNATPAAVKAA
jgi:type I restriction enzyme M protein